MTETATAATISTPENHRFGTVGRALPGVELKIAEDGEILIKGPNIFQGYHNQADTSFGAVEDGWLHTGDLGSIDEDGYLSITGRKKDIIITAGGKNLTPANIENDLKQCRWISQAVMHGDQRPYPVVLITLDEEEIPVFAREHGLPEDIASLVARPRRARADPARDRPRQRQIRAGRAGQEVRDPRPRPLPGDGRADAHAEGQAQRRQREVRGPVRRAVRRLTGRRPRSCEHRTRCAATPPRTADCSSGAGRAPRRFASARCPSAAAPCASASTARSRTLAGRGDDVLSLLCWGPIPLACLWLGSQVNYLSGSVSLGILVSVRRRCSRCCSARLRCCAASTAPGSSCAAPPGHDQRTGALGRIFAVTAVVCALGFLLWFLVIHGPGATASATGRGAERAAPPTRIARARLTPSPEIAARTRPYRGPARLLPPVRRDVRGGGQRAACASRPPSAGARRSPAWRRSTSPRRPGRSSPTRASSTRSPTSPARGLHRYPHLHASDLRDELAERHGVDPARLILGNGAAELLSSATRALIAARPAAAHAAGRPIRCTRSWRVARTAARCRSTRRRRRAARGRARGRHARDRAGEPQRPDRRAAAHRRARAAARRAARRRRGAARRVARRVRRRPAHRRVARAARGVTRGCSCSAASRRPGAWRACASATRSADRAQRSCWPSSSPTSASPRSPRPGALEALRSCSELLERRVQEICAGAPAPDRGAARARVRGRRQPGELRVGGASAPARRRARRAPGARGRAGRRRRRARRAAHVRIAHTPTPPRSRAAARRDRPGAAQGAQPADAGLAQQRARRALEDLAPGAHLFGSSSKCSTTWRTRLAEISSPWRSAIVLVAVVFAGQVLGDRLEAVARDLDARGEAHHRGLEHQLVGRLGLDQHDVDPRIALLPALGEFVQSLVGDELEGLIADLRRSPCRRRAAGACRAAF